MTTLGSILPSIIGKFGLSGGDAGTLFLFITFGMLGGSVTFGPVVDRFGYKTLLVVSTALIAAGIEGIAFGYSIGVVKASLLLVGFGGGIINGGANALVADIAEEGKSAELSLLGVFFGLGAFGVPFVLGIMTGILSYVSIMAGIGALMGIPLLFFIVTIFPSPKIVQGFPIREGFALLKNPLLVILGCILFFESGIEMAAGGWISSFFNVEFGSSADRAVIILSFYWLGLMDSRLALNYILKHVSPKIVFLVSIFVSLTGTTLLMATGSSIVATAGVVLLGAGLASAFPVILGYVGDMYPELSGTAFGIVLVMALIGGMLLPYAVGVSGDAVGLRLSFGIVALSLVCQALLFLVFSVRHSGNSSAR